MAPATSARAHEAQRASNSQAADGHHGLCAVEQRKSFLGGKLNGLEAGALQRLAARDALTLVERFAFANHHEGKMRERGEVAAGAYGALLGDHRMNAGVEQRDKKFEDLDAGSAEALGEDVGAQQKHGARFGLAEGIANAARVAADEVGLQLRQVLIRNAHVGKFSESGIDAINGLAGGDDLLNQRAAGGDTLAGG